MNDLLISGLNYFYMDILEGLMIDNGIWNYVDFMEFSEGDYYGLVYVGLSSVPFGDW